MMLDNSVMNYNKIMKQRISQFICLLLVALSLSVSAEDEDSFVLKVVTEDVYPLNYIDQTDGLLKGFAVDYLIDILDAAEMKYSIDVMPWPRTYKTALTQPNVLIFGLARTQQREDKFIWLTDFITLEFYLYGLKSRREELSKTDIDFITSPIGVIRNDYNHSEMIAAGYSNLIPAEEHRHLARLLTKKRADFIVSGGSDATFFNVRNGLDSNLLYRALPLEFLNLPTYYALSNGTDSTVEAKLRTAIQKLKSDPNYRQPSPPSPD